MLRDVVKDCCRRQANKLVRCLKQNYTSSFAWGEVARVLVLPNSRALGSVITKM